MGTSGSRNFNEFARGEILRYLPNFYRVQIFIGNTVAYIDTKIRKILNGMEDGGVPGFGQKSP